MRFTTSRKIVLCLLILAVPIGLTYIVPPTVGYDRVMGTLGHCEAAARMFARYYWGVDVEEDRLRSFKWVRRLVDNRRCRVAVGLFGTEEEKLQMRRLYRIFNSDSPIWLQEKWEEENKIMERDYGE